VTSRRAGSGVQLTFVSQSPQALQDDADGDLEGLRISNGHGAPGLGSEPLSGRDPGQAQAPDGRDSAVQVPTAGPGEGAPADGPGIRDELEGKRVLKTLDPQQEQVMLTSLAAKCREWLARSRTRASEDALLLEQLESRLVALSNGSCESHESHGSCDDSDAPGARTESSENGSQCRGEALLGKGEAGGGLPGDRAVRERRERSSTAPDQTPWTAAMNMCLAVRYRMERKLLLQRVIDGLEVQAALLAPYV
jgi:hypothetical protein